MPDLQYNKFFIPHYLNSRSRSMSDRTGNGRVVTTLARSHPNETTETYSYIYIHMERFQIIDKTLIRLDLIRLLK